MENKKYVLITGACGGIGKALTQVFNDNGYSVIASDRLPKIDDVHCDYYMQADLVRSVAEPEYMDSIVEEVMRHTNGEGIHALINNAALQVLVPTAELSRTQWSNTLQTNLLAPFFWSQSFLDILKMNKGAIVNISSIHATQTKKNFVAYATSKAALSSLTRNMALDLAGDVRINAIEPAAVATDMLKAGFEGKEDKFKELERFHPLGRIAYPAEIAKLAAYLCSENASFIHGACINASGGIHACLSDPD